MRDNKTRLVIVGGFLGAGKTSLLYEATKFILKDFNKVGLITNDQAPELVDTAYLLQTDAKVTEVSGSCFCCNFNGLINSIKLLRDESQANFIIAEPVGSCTDLSATIMQPLKAQFNEELIISPLTVLADPIKLAEILDGKTAGLHPDAAYIFEKQLEESDIILITKTDLLENEKIELLKQKTKLHYPTAAVLSVCAKTGAGIADWLEQISSSTKIGHKIIEVDYDRYAAGEAILGWLNSTITLKGEAINWDIVANTFLKKLSEKIDSLKLSVGHIKIIIENGAKCAIGNITGRAETLSIRGKAGISNEAQLIINARVGINPGTLEKLVKVILEQITGSTIKTEIKAWQCLRPGYPQPTFRFNKVINAQKN